MASVGIARNYAVDEAHQEVSLSSPFHVTALQPGLHLHWCGHLLVVLISRT